MCIDTIDGKWIRDSSLELNEIVYHDEPSEIYLGSPSIVRLASGRLVASHDFFGTRYGSQPRNSSIYISDDNGETWTFTSYIKHSNCATLTVYKNNIYAIGVDNDAKANIIIHRSSDNGSSWNYNGDDNGVILFQGSYATAPTPIVMANQVMYRAFENFPPPYRVPGDYQATIISCDLSKFPTVTDDDDPLMSAKNWRMTPPLPFDKNWIPKEYSSITSPGLSNGNVVILPKVSSPSGDEVRVLNVLRFYSAPFGNLAIILELNQTTNTLSFLSIIPFPGGQLKFSIRYDPISKTYLALVNPLTQTIAFDQRNLVILSHTKDLINLTGWNTTGQYLLYDDTGLAFNDSLRYTGFHFVDWQFDHLASTTGQASCIEWNCDGGPDLIFVIRTGYRGANSYHNSNRITYKVLKNYRQFLE